MDKQTKRFINEILSLLRKDVKVHADALMEAQFGTRSFTYEDGRHDSAVVAKDIFMIYCNKHFGTKYKPTYPKDLYKLD
jgi:hypothetical protein